MMRNVVELGQRLRIPILTLAVAIIGLGVWQLPNAKQEVLPEFGPVYVEVQTEALGLSAVEVENLITVPLEQNLLNGVAWLENIHSQSIPGLSSIVLIFEPGTDPLRARQMVAERLTQAPTMLPRVSKPPTMLQPLSSASRVVMVRLTPSELSLIQTSVLARWTLRPALMGVPGVANVSIWGMRERQLQVQVDPQRLNEQGILLSDVVSTTGNALWVSPLTYLEGSAPGTGGFIDTANQRLGVQHLLPIGSPDELAQVPIEGCLSSYGEQAADGTPVCPTIGDVATVAENHQPLIGDSIATDGGSLLLVIEKFPDADTEEVTAGIETMLTEMAPGLNGVVVDPTVYQRADLIDTVMKNLSTMLLIGLGLAVLVVLMMLFDWRSALISAVSIPLSLMMAALILYLRGETFNIIVVAGLVIALGIIIDDVVVDVENIQRRLHEARANNDERSRTSIVIAAALEARGPALVAAVIVLLASLPILMLGGLFDAFFMGGQSGAFLQPIVVSYALAIVASLIVSLLVTPTLATLLLSRAPRTERGSPVIAWLQPRYHRLIQRTSPAYAISAGIVAILLALGIALLPQIDEPDSIVPATQDRHLLISWEGASSASLTEMTRITSRISAELRTVPGVENVGAHVGRALTSDQVVDVNSGELWVSISSSVDYDDTVATIEEIVQGYPGLEHTVQTYLEDRMDAVVTSTDELTVRIYGQDPAILLDRANAVQQLLSGIDGVSSPRIIAQAQQPEIQIEVDLAAAEQYGLVPGDVRRTAAILVNGLEVGSLFEEQKVFEVIVLGVGDIRGSVSSIENILIDTPDGGQVRLGDVATVRLAPVVDSIRHDAVLRYVDVAAALDGRGYDAVSSEIEDQLVTLTFPLDYHAQVVGDFSEAQDASLQLLGITLFAAIGIFLVLQAGFRSWRRAFLAFICLPTALTGGIMVTWLRDSAFTLGVLLGLLAVFALAARNSFMLISHYQDLEEAGSAVDVNMVARGAQERMAPILITALATAVAVAPFAITGDRPGLELVSAIAITMLGGLVTTTIVNLVILPSLYLWIARGSAAPATSPSGDSTIAMETPGATAD